VCQFDPDYTSIDIDQNTQVKIMPGFSILPGREERFIINGGAVSGTQGFFSCTG
jgi:hypothetical protein